MITPKDIGVYEPLNTLKPLAHNLWIVDGPAVTMSIFGVSFPFPTRMTIIRLSNGELWCHSPTQLTPSLQAEIDDLGTVRHLIAPNKLHYVYISGWAKVYPNAITWAANGTKERANQQGILVEFQETLTSDKKFPWHQEIDNCNFKSQFMEEVVFFHRSSKTLIITDLIQNFEPQRIPKWLTIPLKLVGNLAPNGRTPIDLRLTFWRHKHQARQQLKKILGWNPQIIIIAHGRNFDKNAVVELQRAFSWLS